MSLINFIQESMEDLTPSCILEEHRHLDSYLLRGSILSLWNIPVHRGTFPCQRFTGNVTTTSAWLRADVGG